MASILTNPSAMAALHTMRAIDRDLATTQARQEEEDPAAYSYSLGLLVPFPSGFFEGGLTRPDVLALGSNEILVALHAAFGLHHLPFQLDLQILGLPQRLFAVGAELLLRRQMLHQAHGSTAEQLPGNALSHLSAQGGVRLFHGSRRRPLPRCAL